MSRPRLFLFLLTLGSSQSVKAKLWHHTYYPDSLTKDLHKENSLSIDLKEKLFEVLNNFHIERESKSDLVVKECPEKEKCYTQDRNISYKQARKHLFGDLHLEKENGKYTVKDLYCNKTYSTESGVGKFKIPDHTKINCEHTWPQSKFNSRMSKNLQKTDLHHLYPVNSRANSTRSNHHYGEVWDRVVNEECTDSYRGIVSGTNMTAFMPPKSHRGNVARAMFYFSVRFKSPIVDIEEETLRRWHEEDPVDQHEILRNEKIFKIQRSRNPFIDDPELVSSIDNF